MISPHKILEDCEIPPGNQLVWRTLRQMLSTCQVALAAEETERQRLEQRLERLERLEQQQQQQQQELQDLFGLDLAPPAPAPPAPAPPAPAPPVLPRLDLAGRLMYVAQRIRSVYPPSQAARDAAEFARSGGGIRLDVALARARAAGVPPRWLAFGEQEGGEDLTGLHVRLSEILSLYEPRFTGRDLACLAEISSGQVSYLLRGSSPRGGPICPTAPMIQRLASVLYCQPGWLAYGDG